MRKFTANITVMHQIAGKYEIAARKKSHTRKIWPELKIGTSIERD
jgi:hypothetical protein